MNKGEVVHEMARLPGRPRWIEFPEEKKSACAYGPAFAAGVLGAAIMTSILAGARRAGITPLDFPVLLGSAVTGKKAKPARQLGLALNLFNGGLFGIAYALALEKLGTSHWKAGILLAAPHTLAAGATMAVAPKSDRAAGHFRAAKPPGFMARNYGWRSVLSLIGSHLVFGASAGALYGALKRWASYSYAKIGWRTQPAILASRKSRPLFFSTTLPRGARRLNGVTD